MAADSKFPRMALRVENLAPLLKQRLENEASILDALVAALARGQAHAELWTQLHEAALRDERLADLAFAYEKLCQERRLRTLAPAVQAEVLMRAATFFADVFGDVEGAASYLERVLAAAPGHAAAFARLEELLIARQDGLSLSDLYAAAAMHEPRRDEQLRMLRRAVELCDGFSGEGDERAFAVQQQILRVDPSDVATRTALEGRYARAGRHADVARLIEQALTGEPPPGEAEALALRGRLIELYANELREIERAMPHVEEVLLKSPSHEPARRVAEELLAHKALAARAAACLEGVFVRKKKWGQAAHMLGTQIEQTRGPKRLEAQKRLALMRFDKLGDLPGAFILYEAIVTSDPADDDARERFKKISAATDKRLDATRVLTRAATGVRDPAVRARIQAELGELFVGLGDTRKARTIFQGVIDGGGDAEAVLRSAIALMGIFTESKEHRALAAVLEKLTEIEPAPAARLAAAERLARVCEADLGDTAAAIAAYGKLLGTGRERMALKALARLHEAAGDHLALATTLARLAEGEKDPAEARALWFRAAAVRATKTPDRVGALEAVRALVERYGPTREAYGWMTPLLEQERRFADLAATLSADAELAPAPEKAAIFARLAQVYQARLQKPDAAFAAYKQALAADPAERTSRLAVEKLLVSPAPVTAAQRLAAADVLEPLYRDEGHHAGTARLLETRAELSTGALARLATLEEAADLVERELADPKRALEIAGRGLATAAALHVQAVRPWLDRIERLGASGGDAARRASILVAALDPHEIASPAIADLARRAGEALVKAGDVAAALSVFRRALAYEPSSPDLLSRVDALLREQGSPAERIALYRAALLQPADRRRRAELLHAIGTIERRDLGDFDAAIATYRRAIEEDPGDRTAYDALLEAHEAKGAWGDLYDELDRGRAHAGAQERTAIALRMAEVAMLRGEPGLAVAHYREVLREGTPIAEQVLDTIERTADAAGHADLLGEVIDRRLAMAIEPQEESLWLERLGTLEIERRQRPQAAAIAWRRAAELAETEADTARASRLYERVLEVAADDRAAATRLVDLYRREGAWEAMPRVYAMLLRGPLGETERGDLVLSFEAAATRARATSAFVEAADTALAAGELPGEKRAALLAARARVLAADPDRQAEAAQAFRRAIDAAQGDPAPFVAAFDELLAAHRSDRDRDDDRRWLFAWRVDHAEEAEKARVLAAWAAAEETVMEAREAAAALHERILADDPDDDGSLAALARVRLAMGDLEGATAATTARRDRSEGSARAALDLEIAGLLERLARPFDALAAVGPVLEASPCDEAALAVARRALAHPEARQAAAIVLERAAEAVEDTELGARMYEALLDAAVAMRDLDAARGRWFERLLERRSGDAEAALDVAVRAVRELPAELGLWDRAERLAREAKRPDRVTAAYRDALLAEDAAPLDEETTGALGQRAVEYHEEWFDAPETVTALLERVAKHVRQAGWAFERLKLQYASSEDWDALLSLYDGALGREPDEATRDAMLEEAALAARDFANDPERAIGYFEALLPRADRRGLVVPALERLYERTARHEALHALLARELSMTGDEAAAGRLHARLATLLVDSLGDAGAAIAHVEHLLAVDPGSAFAFDLLERIAATPAGPGGAAEVPDARREARRRAVRLLEAQHREAGRTADLVRVLAGTLDDASASERAARLREILALRLDVLGDQVGALDTLALLVEAEPGDAAHRAQIAALAAKLGRRDRLAEVLASAAEQSDGPALQIELLAEALLVCEGELHDTSLAITVGTRVLAAARAPEVELEAARALDRLLASAERPAERCDVLDRLARIETDPLRRKAALVASAHMSVTVLGDPDRAVRAFQGRLTEDPGDRDALDGLVASLEALGRSRELTQVLERRAATLADPAAARRDRAAVARILGDDLDATDEAVAAWKGVRDRYGDDDESADALRCLYERAGRWDDLGSLLTREAERSTDAARRSSLLRHLGDMHRDRTGLLADATAAYESATLADPADSAPRRALEVLLGQIDPAADDLLAAAVSVLAKSCAEADDSEGLVRLLEPRLRVARDDDERARVLIETAALLERDARDLAAAFDATWRAFAIAPGRAELGLGVLRLATAAGRMADLAARLPALGAEARAIPATVARDLWLRVGLWQRDEGGSPAPAEAALVRALAEAPGDVEVLGALAGVQRRAPGQALIATLLALSEALGGDLALLREAAEAALGAARDRDLARVIAARLLDLAAGRWVAEAAAAADDDDDWAAPPPSAEPAAWALDRLVRLCRDDGDTAGVLALELRAATLPFDAAEKRKRRLAAAEVADTEQAIAIYLELFLEDTRDALVSERLDALYRREGRLGDLLALRELELSTADGPARRVALRLDLARLLVESGAPDRAVEALQESLQEAPLDAPSVAALAALHEAAGRSDRLADLLADQAALREARGDSLEAQRLWAHVAAVAEASLGSARATEAHRRAAALGRDLSLGDLARLLAAAGDHEGAAEALEQLASKGPASALPAQALGVAEAWIAAGKPARAIGCLERAAAADDAAAVRERLAALYRETSAFGPLAALVAADGARPGPRRERVAALREAGELYVRRLGDAASAVPLLEQAATLAPDDPGVGLALGEALRGAGRLDDSTRVLRAVIAGYGARRPKERALVHHELARAALLVGDRAGALAELDLALRIDPAHPDVLHAMAKLALAEGQLDRAARSYRALLLVVRRPRDERDAQASRAEILVALGSIAERQGEPDRAAEFMESAFEAARTEPFELDRLLEGLAHGSRGELHARALELALDGAEPGERTDGLVDELARVYADELQRPGVALDVRLRALSRAPASAAAHHAALAAASRADRVADYVALASRLLEGAAGTPAAVDLAMHVGLAHEAAGHDAEAAASYRAAEAQLTREKGLAPAPGGAHQLADVWRALEGVYARLGDTTAQAGLLEQQASAAASAFASAAEQADPLYRLASLRLAKAGDPAGGVALLERAFELDGDADRAEAALRAAIEADASCEPALRLLERVARQSGRARTLAFALVQLVGAGAAPEGALREAFEVAMTLGDRPLAGSILRRVLARPGDSAIGAWAMIELASLREAEGDVAEAAALEEQAAAFVPDEQRRPLLLHVAQLAEGPLADLPRAARLYDALRSAEPADRALWEPLAAVYRALGDDTRLGELLRETVPLVDSIDERCRLRLEHAEMLIRAMERGASSEALSVQAVTLLREVLDDDASQRRPAMLLAAIFEREARHDELAELLSQQLDAAKDREDKASVVALSTRLGALHERRSDDDAALDVYHAALDWDAESRDALRAVIRLSLKRDDSIDLGDALGSLLEVEQGDEAAELAKRLAELRRAHGDHDGALQALAKGYAASPASTDLRDELIRLYTAKSAWRELAGVYTTSATALAPPAERVACLCLAADVLRDHAGDEHAAAIRLEEALSLAPADPRALHALVDTCKALGDPARAVRAVSLALDEAPADASLHALRGALHGLLDEGDRALADLERAYAGSGGGFADELVAALEREASRAGIDAARRRALRLRTVAVVSHAGDVARARATLAELVRADGRDAGALRALAALEDAEGRWDAATATYRRLLALEEGAELVVTALRLADACERGLRLGDARGALERALRVAPGDPAVRAKLRAVYVATGAKRELASLILEDAAAAADVAGRFTQLLEAGRLLLESGEDAERAASVLEEARALCPGELVGSLLLADAYTQARRSDAAVALLAQAAGAYKGRRSRELSAIHHRIARVQLSQGELSESLVSLVKAFDNDPTNASLAMELGLSAIDLDDIDIAARAFRAVTLMKPPPADDAQAPVSKAVAYYYLGQIARAQGDRRKARLMAERALTEDASLDVARDLLDALRDG